jgi:hypothetical protein
MEDYQKRVVDEKNDLDAKIQLLHNFMFTTSIGAYDKLPIDEKQRLIEQLRIMEIYSHILGERIRNF